MEKNIIMNENVRTRILNAIYHSDCDLDGDILSVNGKSYFVHALRGDVEELQVTLNMDYYFKGSINCSLTFIPVSDGLNLITNYGEKIACVQSGEDLMHVLEDLHNNKFA